MKKSPPLVLLPSLDLKVLPVNFILCDCPSASQDIMEPYVQFFAERHCLHISRICDSSWYNASVLLQKLASKYYQSNEQVKVTEEGNVFSCVLPDSNITLTLADTVHFEDGNVPSREMVEIWLEIVGSVCQLSTVPESIPSIPQTTNVNSSHPLLMTLTPGQVGRTIPSIAVHCVSGLGRAPVLVAIAILEYFPSMDVLDVIQWIRGYRKGALNSLQIHWLENDYDKKLRRKNWKKRRQRIIGATSSNDSVRASSSSVSEQNHQQSRLNSFFGKLFGGK
jgi:protein tyrosine phosphatase type 4A